MTLEEVKENDVHIGFLDRQNKVYSRWVTFKNRKRTPKDSWSIYENLFTNVLLPDNYKIIYTDRERNIKYELFANEILKGNSYTFGTPPHGKQIYKFIEDWRVIE